MNESSENDVQEHLDDLLVQWELGRQVGNAPSLEELCRDRPQLHDQLARSIRVLETMDWATDPLQLVDDPIHFESTAQDTQIVRADVTIAEFLETLGASGILTGGQMQELGQSAPADPQANAAELAQDLVNQGVLTLYQAKVIAERGDSPLLLDRYIVLDTIGAGGMGIVFKALQTSLDRVVAVKILPKHAIDSTEKIERFQREMKAAASISHPNVVQAFDAHESNGVYFFAMEYVPGSDLAALVEADGPLPVDAAVDVITQVAAGLMSAHDKGIVHRDVKPGNILLSDDGTAKVLDLGLARTKELLQASKLNDLTRDGLVMGTVTYMSPEQAFDAREADARSDIYSLGCTLYYLLHGRPMYDYANSVQTVVAHRERPVPRLGEGRNDVPQWLEELFTQMVAKSPSDRPQSMKDVQLRLEAQGLHDEAQTPAAGGANLASPPATRSPTSQALAPQAPTSQAPGTNAQTDQLSLEQRTTARADEVESRGNPTLLSQPSIRWIISGLGTAAALGLFYLGWMSWLGPTFKADAGSRAMAAEMLSERSDTLELETADGIYLVEAAEELPDEDFNIAGAFIWSDEVGDLARFEDLRSFRRLVIQAPSEIGSMHSRVSLHGLSKLIQLQDLSIESCRLDATELKMIRELPALIALHLTDCQLSEPAVAELRQMTFLRDLTLDQFGNGAQQDLTWLAELKELELLDLSATQVNEDTFKQLAVLPNLGYLYLTGLEIDEAIQQLAKLTELELLSLDGTDLADRHVPLLKPLNKVVSLDVSHSRLTEAGIKQLSQLVSLEELTLQGLRVQTSIDEFARMPNLQFLDLTDTNINDAALEMLSASKSLTSIYVDGTHVSRQAIDRFQLRNPRCEIFSDFDIGYGAEAAY